MKATFWQANAHKAARRASRRTRRVWALGALILVAALAVTGCAKSGGAGSEDDPIEPELAMGIERPLDDQVTPPFTVSGWAIDRAAQEGSGVRVVQIVDEGCEGAVIGVAEYGLKRADIGSRFGQQFLHSGWQFEVSRLRPGDHTLAVRIGGAEVENYNQCQAIQITVE